MHVHLLARSLSIQVPARQVPLTVIILLLLLCRPNNPVQPGGVPPRPPTRPLHTLSTEDMSARLDSCDGNYYEQMTSPNYVDPKELNPKNQGEEEAYRYRFHVECMISLYSQSLRPYIHKV